MPRPHARGHHLHRLRVVRGDPGRVRGVLAESQIQRVPRDGRQHRSRPRRHRGGRVRGGRVRGGRIIVRRGRVATAATAATIAAVERLARAQNPERAGQSPRRLPVPNPPEVPAAAAFASVFAAVSSAVRSLAAFSVVSHALANASSISWTYSRRIVIWWVT